MHLKLLWFLVVLIFPAIIKCQVPDSCNIYSFQKIYSTPEFDEVYGVQDTPDGGIITVGRIGDQQDNNDALIMKLNWKGDVSWAKRIGGTGNDHFKKIIQTIDGGYIAVGQTNSFGQTFGRIFLVKLDWSGNVTWARALGVQSVLIDKAFTIIQTRDGGYAITGSNNPAMNELAVIRLDKNGGTLWQKNYNMFGAFSNAPGGILEEGDSLVVAGSCQGVVPAIFIEDEFIMKINQANGNVYWAKHWPGGILFSDLYKHNNNYYINHRINNSMGISKLDMGGNILGSFYLSDNTTNGFLNFCLTHDNSMIISERTGQVNLIKANENGTIQWANQYVVPGTVSNHLNAISESAGNQMIGGGIAISGTDNTSDIIIMKKNEDGLPVNCPITAFNSSEVPFTITSQSFSWSYIHSDNPFINIPVIPVSANVILSINDVCTSLQNCSLLKISGADTVCNLADTFTYRSLRNQGCSMPIRFTIDPSYGKVTNLNDSTVSIKFLQKGIAKLYAQILTSCKILTDSLTINIANFANSLNLGTDTSLCRNSPYTLNAHSGFKSYRWQDGSTDSVFIANSPGQYYVTATSYCDIVFSDTINLIEGTTEFLDIGNDTAKCNNDTLALTATFGFSSYTWSPNYNISSTNGHTVYIFPNVDTTYKVTAAKNTGCNSVDSVKIKVHHSIPINIGGDTSFCTGNDIVLDAGTGFINYLWNTGASSREINVDSPGQYTIVALDTNKCISTDTLTVKTLYEHPLISLQKDTVLCEGNKLLLDAGGGFASYLWQDGSSSQTYIATTLGKYLVTVTDNHQCRGSDSIEITKFSPSPSNFIVKDTAICEGQTILLIPSGQFSNYLWSTGDVSAELTISSFGHYWLQVTNNSGCTTKEFITITAKNCVKSIYFPNVFTPNKDGLNETFKATVYGTLKNFHLFVYNHFGQKVFDTNDETKGWNGQYKGTDINVGTFAWYAEYQFMNEPLQKRKGVVILAR